MSEQFRFRVGDWAKFRRRSAALAVPNPVSVRFGPDSPFPGNGAFCDASALSPTEAVTPPPSWALDAIQSGRQMV